MGRFSNVQPYVMFGVHDGLTWKSNLDEIRLQNIWFYLPNKFSDLVKVNYWMLKVGHFSNFVIRI